MNIDTHLSLIRHEDIFYLSGRTADELGGWCFRGSKGTLIVDATCTPADMRFPTDLGLLNEAREKQDEIIDTLHEANGKVMKRPRTYRKKAKKDYLTEQLQYCRRNLGIVDRMLQEPTTGSGLLSKR